MFAVVFLRIFRFCIVRKRYRISFGFPNADCRIFEDRLDIVRIFDLMRSIEIDSH